MLVCYRHARPRILLFLHFCIRFCISLCIGLVFGGHRPAPGVQDTFYIRWRPRIPSKPVSLSVLDYHGSKQTDL